MKPSDLSRSCQTIIRLENFTIPVHLSSTETNRGGGGEEEGYLSSLTSMGSVREMNGRQWLVVSVSSSDMLCLVSSFASPDVTKLIIILYRHS